MKKHLSIAAAICFAAGTVQAATVSTSFDFSVDDQSLFGLKSAASFGDSKSLNLGFATVGYSAAASTGTVDSYARTDIGARFADELSLGEAVNAEIDLSVLGGTGGFTTALGASARAYIDIHSIIGINPAPYDVIDAGYSLSAGATTSTLGFEILPGPIPIPIPVIKENAPMGRTISGEDSAAITGVGLPATPGITVAGGVDLDGRQTSTLTYGDLTGVVKATHSSGNVVTGLFSLLTGTSINLDLSLEGDWLLELVNVKLNNTFDSIFGLGGTAYAGVGVGVFCGDLSTDSDNILCATELYTETSTPTLDLINISPYSLNYGLEYASLGTIRVLAAEVSAVPLPATLPLFAIGLGAVGLVRPRRS